MTDAKPTDPLAADAVATDGDNPQDLPETVIAAVPESTSINYRRLWAYGGAALLTVIVGMFMVNFLAFFLGVVLLYAGIPYGLIAFVITAVLHYRAGKRETVRFGLGSVFGTFPQVATLFINATLAALALFGGLLILTGNLVPNSPFTTGGASIFFLSLFYIPVAAALLIGVSAPVFFGREHIAQERYAMLHRLPARVWIIINRSLALFVYLVVVGVTLWAWLTSY